MTPKVTRRCRQPNHDPVDHFGVFPSVDGAGPDVRIRAADWPLDYRLSCSGSGTQRAFSSLVVSPSESGM